MTERFLIIKIDNTAYGIKLDDVEQILDIKECEIDYSNSESGNLKIGDSEIPISKLCYRLKTFRDIDSDVNAIIIERNKEKIVFLVSGKIDIAHLDEIQKREVNFVDEISNYIDKMGIISEKPVIILKRDAIFL
ncbi:chemotaxis protein CheW [bacterium]|nr:chemotaxis protein CheW [bacterium]